MPRKKKMKTIADQEQEVLERYEKMSMLIIPPSDRGHAAEVAAWQRRIGNVTVVSKNVTKVLKDLKGDFTHAVVGREWTTALHAIIQQVVSKETKIVTFQWFDESRMLPSKAKKVP